MKYEQYAMCECDGLISTFSVRLCKLLSISSTVIKVGF